MPTLQLALVALLLVACGAAIAQQRWPLAGWSVCALLGASAGVFIPTVAPILPAPELAYWLGVPPLLFAGTWQLEGRLVRTQLSPVLLVATLGVAIATAAIGSALVYLSPLTLTSSLALGLALAATSAALVVPALATAGTPRALSALLAGESALSQVVAALGFSAIASLAAPTAFDVQTWQPLLLDLAAVGLGGALLGSLGGALLHLSLRAAKRQPLVQIVLILAAVWTVFALATSVQVSGAIAVSLLGLVAGWGAASELSPSNRELLHALWSYLVYAIGAIACLLAGWAGVASLDSLDAWFTGVWLLVAVVVGLAIARALSVYLLLPLANALRQVTPLDWRVQTLLLVGGARSPLGLVLLLSLPSAGEAPRGLLLALALAALLLTTGIARASLVNLAGYLELARPRLALRVERLQALLAAQREALQQFADRQRFQPWAGAAMDAIVQDYSEAVYQAEQSLLAIWSDQRLPAYDRQQVLWLQALNLEVMGYRYLYDRGFLSEPVLAKLELRMTLRRDAALQGFLPPPFVTLRTQVAGWQLRLASGLGSSRSERWVRQQLATAKYEADAAIACVSAQVAETLERSLAEGELPAAIAEGCAAAYREDSQVASRNLAALARQEPRQVRTYQQHIVQRIAALGEQDALEQLVRDGTLDAKLARLLRPKW